MQAAQTMHSPGSRLTALPGALQADTSPADGGAHPAGGAPADQQPAAAVPTTAAKGSAAGDSMPKQPHGTATRAKRRRQDADAAPQPGRRRSARLAPGAGDNGP
jgi:hypothetical protein